MIEWMLFRALRPWYPSRVKGVFTLLAELCHKSGRRNRFHTLSPFASSLNDQRELKITIRTKQLCGIQIPVGFVPFLTCFYKEQKL